MNIFCKIHTRKEKEFMYTVVKHRQSKLANAFYKYIEKYSADNPVNLYCRLYLHSFGGLR